MNLVKEKQGVLNPAGLKRWPLKLIKHFVDTTHVSPSPAGPAGCCPLDFLNLINLKFEKGLQIGAAYSILLEGLNRFHGAPTSPLVQMSIKTHRCLVCMQDP